MAVIAKFDSRVFCHINSLEDKISNTAATIQLNLFGLGEINIYWFHIRKSFKWKLFRPTVYELRSDEH